MSNHFLINFIESSGGVTSEFQMLKYIEKRHAHFFESLGVSPSLYKKHFFLFHCLYRLRDEVLPDQSLAISSLSIKLSVRQCHTKEVADVDELRDFYLDKDNLHLTDLEISEMLNTFWQKYLAINEKAEAIKLLGLEKIERLSLLDIKKRYNQLAIQHHPDKGGDEKCFIKLQQAYSHLRKIYH